MKRIKALLLVCILLAATAALPGCFPEKDYGVFIGAGPEEMDKLQGYKTVVIDAQYFTAEEIAQLHEAGQIVYSYLNVGTLESFRDYYADFEPYTVSIYDDWPDESWIDVSAPAWRNYITFTVAGELARKGVDGFLVDNLDVYSVTPGPHVFDAITGILTALNEAYGLPVIVNGADLYMRELMETEYKDLVYGVNQEEVFTTIDFADGTYADQTPEDTAYYMEYLDLCKQASYQVYLTEYDASWNTANQIKSYCDRNGFQYYIADGLELS